MARNHLGSKSPFRTATLWLIWGWLLIFALLPNILVIAVSF
ncbi:MAG TPA: spermidine/putrescine ABC transporter permease, partial [Psychrobacter sp.]|nr:spermidine/putrescine ABC transporter permease [Psychrobacter sp.]